MFIHQQNATIHPVLQWPAPGGVTEQQAKIACENRIVSSTYIGNSCAARLRNDTTTRNIVQGCIDDIQVRLAIEFYCH